ncbi:uncharacterized protein LOC110825284 [Carica papaya]|uniref:uncharacterized protein LOC110825284 n=1 Tax=Carica papaya TaxID=3649 RepID=UPI000B8CBD72|nr:uncharacterized protein LOC110825284 [Carica papaya]XP_021911514.1 uncharacterized protein LOC110825284 [Carica papaya]
MECRGGASKGGRSGPSGVSGDGSVDHVPQIYSQRNIYEAGQKKIAFKYLTEKAADREDARSGCIKSEGDLFINETRSGLMATTAESEIFHPSEYYPTWTVEAPTEALKQFLQHCTGWQRIPRPADNAVPVFA